MARGLESKDVEFQQAEAERGHMPRRALTPEEREALNRRRTVELSLARAKADLTAARTELVGVEGDRQASSSAGAE